MNEKFKNKEEIPPRERGDFYTTRIQNEFEKVIKEQQSITELIDKTAEFISELDPAAPENEQTIIFLQRHLEHLLEAQAEANEAYNQLEDRVTFLHEKSAEIRKKLSP